MSVCFSQNLVYLIYPPLKFEIYRIYRKIQHTPKTDFFNTEEVCDDSHGGHQLI